MDWYESVYELIDMRSFSNLWFWIALAVAWSTASHWVLGVPYDLVQRARMRGGQAAEDVAALVAINMRRVLYIARVAGVWIVALGGFALSMLIVLGFVYGSEICQAVVLLGGPFALVWLMTVRLAHRIESTAPEGEALYRCLRAHRLRVQLVGISAIFFTAMWGMWQNMQIGALGG
ncbi:component of SufBCD complex [Rhodovulum adriaticum]|uniref:Component of SufBCD complex n=1 Tax=Rhodovulum adriaticum TaxID=35804 RepID=A0A4R2NWW7_RHOAD|nr:component of SufBCD complex [Rhodovulum adriaticum]MBK1636612.1 component of SufBCD complex [Rhodovulum adriaticum]TCP26101.1 hypothetical protein EV656_10263 [Rhodovulum adriaticum]